MLDFLWACLGGFRVKKGPAFRRFDEGSGFKGFRA